MKVEVTEVGPVKRVLKIEVPSEEVNRQFAEIYAELNRKVQVPGFRPGKAPLSLLEQRYGKDVSEDVIRRLIPTYYEKAIRQTGLVPILVEVPPVERVKIKKNAPFSFTATVEIKPKVELREYKAPHPIVLKQDTRTVTEEQVARALEELREQQARLEPAPAGTALADGLYAELEVEGFVDGVPLDGTKTQGLLHRVGSKTPILGMDVEDQLLGKQAGQVFDIAQPYPADHPDRRVAGKTVVFRFTVTAVRRKWLPALDDEFAKDCGPYGTLAELKAKLRGEMEEALKREIEEAYKDAIMKRLEEAHHVDIPETLVERELAAMIRQKLEQDARSRDQRLATNPSRLSQQTIGRMREEFRPEARRRVKIGLILEAIAEKEGIEVNESDIEAEIKRMAQEMRRSVEEVKKMVEAGGDNALEELRGHILADKALEFVYRQAVIQP